MGLGMPRKRASQAPLALALDGSLLLNTCARIAPALIAKVAHALSIRPADLFIATLLPPAQHRETLSRLDDAAAEAAARIHGLVGQKAPSTRKRRSLKKPDDAR
jgi:hypothetical protein